MPRGYAAPRKVINGVPHKLCRGASHGEPQFVPVADFRMVNYTKRGKKQRTLMSECKACETNRKGAEQMYPFRRVQPFVLELIRKLGKVEAARRIGISQPMMWTWLNRPPRYIKRKNARSVLRVLHEVREKGEIRSRDSIHHGASARGREDRQATGRSDLYIRNGDNEMLRQRQRREDPEFREADNSRRRAALKEKRERKRREAA